MLELSNGSGATCDVSISPEQMAGTTEKTDAVLPGALSGVRVLDLTTVLMGPYTTQLLGDMGADVIKVEPPVGDSARTIGPMRHPGMGASFLHNNRNKRSIVLDLKASEGRQALLRMAVDADVVVSNIRPKALARLGLPHSAFAAVNPRIVTVCLVGYGQDGPYSDKPAYDDLIQGVLAIPSLNAAIGNGTPQYVPLTIMDRAAALSAVGAVTAALFFRERTGQGQAIEIPMFESLAPLVLGEHMSGKTFDPPEGPIGYPRLLARERRAYATSDGSICVLVYNDKHWSNYFKLIGKPEQFENDPRFADLGARTRHASEICAMLAETISTRTTAEWLAAFESADIPAMPLHDIESLLEDPHLHSTGFFRTLEHPTEGRIKALAPLGKWSASPTQIRLHAPRLGEHSIELLREVGFSREEVDALLRAGVTTIPGEKEREVLE